MGAVLALVLAHGGSVGLAFEIGFILLPVLIFAFLARWSKRKQQEVDAEQGEEAEEAEREEQG